MRCYKVLLIFSVGREEPPLTSPAAQHLVSSRVEGGMAVLLETVGAALVQLCDCSFKEHNFCLYACKHNRLVNTARVWQ